ncbi:MAG: hypothetical protein QM754_12445 [Tepidisphaeraceae bacterium]
MILVDVNVLLYARFISYRQHPAARDWLELQLAGPQSVGLPWESLNGFMRIATNPKLFETPMTVAEAWLQVKTWISAKTVWIPQAGPRHVEIMDRLIAGRPFSTKLVSDVHLAAIAIEHDLVVCSADADFGTLNGVRWHNPLAT